MVVPTLPDISAPALHHPALNTTFEGIVHSVSTREIPVHQYRGIKYASIPARFRQSKLFANYGPSTDSTRYGPICPQPKMLTSEEEMFGLPPSDIPRQTFKQSEFECLNLNITCPGNVTPDSRLPVLLWIHGGGDRGSGSSWIYDGGRLVRESMVIGKPVIVVTINYRLGLFGCAASPALRDDNKEAGDEGVGNYGLRDQHFALNWVHSYICAFGGSPSNITLCGASTGAADIIAHLFSHHNIHPSLGRPRLFARAIVQSPVVDLALPDVRTAGVALSRVMQSLRVRSTGGGVDALRALPADELVRAVDHGVGWDGTGCGRIVDDGVWFGKGGREWRERVSPPRGQGSSSGTVRGRSRSRSRDPALSQSQPPGRSRSRPPMSRSQTVSEAVGSHHAHNHHHSPHHTVPVAPLQPLLIGDTCSEGTLWAASIAAAGWASPSAVARRVHAVIQRNAAAANVVRSYDLNAGGAATEWGRGWGDMMDGVDEMGWGARVGEVEVREKVEEMVGDLRVGWGVECCTRAAASGVGPSTLHPSSNHWTNADHLAGRVYRYVFDQAGPVRGVPHHAADLMYLWDTAPVPVGKDTTEESESFEVLGWYEGGYDEDSADADAAQFDFSQRADEILAQINDNMSPAIPQIEVQKPSGGETQGFVSAPPFVHRHSGIHSPLSSYGSSIQSPISVDPLELDDALAFQGPLRTSPLRRSPLTPDSGSAHESYDGSDCGTNSTLVDVEGVLKCDDHVAGADGGWLNPVVDHWTYKHIREAIQGRWIAFAWGEEPWEPYNPSISSPRHGAHNHGAHNYDHDRDRSHRHTQPAREHADEGSVYVFGPEGETGARSARIFEGRRRRRVWDAVLGPLGPEAVGKLGLEMSRGPGGGAACGVVGCVRF